MRKSTFSESQIVGILKDAESGVPRLPPKDKLLGVGRVLQNIVQIADEATRGE